MNNTYLAKIKHLISKKMGIEPGDITEESYFEDDLNMSEMEVIELLTELEDEFQIDLMEEKDNITSVEDLINVLTEKLD